jgi:pyruvate kinase
MADRYIPRTKIICTLGPASDSAATVRKMMLAGMDVARLNFSHGTHPQHARRIALVRRLNKTHRRHILILQDLQGFRIRIGRLNAASGQTELKKRQVLLFTNDPAASRGAIPLGYSGPLTDIRPGNMMFIDDGNICVRALSSSRSILKAEVIVPGTLKENKGVNIPEAKLRFGAMTAKDKEDILFGVRNGVDFIAQSFVRSAQDILDVRRCIQHADENAKCRVIAKIENRDGIRNIEDILHVSDGIMIARGDMGVSLPIYEVPMIQKSIIKKCRRKGKFSITATQMLESMTENLRPTRAEVADVANAIIDGSDYVMLSAESAVGKHPVEAVAMMNQVIKFTEQTLHKY